MNQPSLELELDAIQARLIEIKSVRAEWGAAAINWIEAALDELLADIADLERRTQRRYDA